MCSPKGIFRQAKDPEYKLPVIGDLVEVKLHKKKLKGVDGLITSIIPRENRLVRADAEGRRERVMAANLDRILVVSAITEPGVDYPMIDRYILTCELSHIPYSLIFNKVDTDPSFVIDEQLAIYHDLDIPILITSAKSGEGMETLADWVAHGINYLTGTSGVGKSTLINALVPDADLATGSVDPRKGRGRHTTTYSTLVPIGDEGYLVDSPGLRDFYPPKVPPEEVRFGFREIVEIQPHCRFSSCLHHEEPDCAVYHAVEEGAIAFERYKSYLFLLGEMQSYFDNKY